MPKFNTKALTLLKQWMVERESVRIKKEAGEFKPWTNDPILRNHRFCNVRREDDTNSKWLIDNIAKNRFMTLEAKILNIITARMYNNITTMGDWFPMHNKDRDKLYWRMDNDLEDGYLCNAYMPVSHQYAAGYFADKTGKSNGKTPSGKPALYRPSNLARMYDEFLEMGVADFIINTEHEGTIHDYLRLLPTMGDFMAYQHFVDLTYIPELDLSEDIFTVCGPGAIMGLQLLFAEDLTDTYRNPNNTPNLSFVTNWGNIDPDELVIWMRDTFDDWFPEWPYDWKPTIMSLENCLCEGHKYIKTTMGWGKPRNEYDGHPESTAQSLFDII